ncbi:hypothetical protein [Streptomyces sp. ST2-7A]|uniref:hypothetical protein n=1 Tax=Streptomyces sp. ST2-7A TaxID=2907214 RepID=UPI001F3AC9B5|nr:hypothetical protein [Streptomyces sp. ST2-7A]MCE7081190.1 hypothetical protein [Streptomyces sp. ST2-7A]
MTTHQETRRALEKAFTAATTAPDGQWRAGLARLVADLADLAGLDKEAAKWGYHSLSDYDRSWGGKPPAQGEITDLIEQQNDHIKRVAHLAGDNTHPA